MRAPRELQGGFLAVLLFAGPVAKAQAPSAASPPVEDLPFPALAPGPLPRTTPGYWSSDLARPFIAMRLDLGYLYAKPGFSFGYGKPFASWGGFDLIPSVTTNAGGGYAGLHLQLGWFELRGGARFVHAFGGQFLTRQQSYSIVDLSEYTGHTENYVDVEAEAAAAVPAGPGNILLGFLIQSIQLAPAGFDVYDETLRVIVAPPPVYRARLGYSLILGREHNGRLGVLVEDLELPDRSSRVIRTGLTGLFDIDDHLQFVATILVPVHSPDTLGLDGADYSELGIRYRWATGHEHIIPAEKIPASGP